MEEVWKDICGYEGLYQVSTFGNVRRIINNIQSRILKGRKNSERKKGFVPYLRVVLFKDGVKKQFCIHKLVAQAFLKNIENKNQVDHIDGNSLNNCVENLRWCTQKENNNNPTHKFNRSIIYNGERARDIAKRNGITREAFSLRLHYGWPLEIAITKPMRKSNRKGK